MGLVLALTVPFASPLRALLVGWCAGVLADVVLIARETADPGVLRQQASRLDDSAPVISLVAVRATAASVGAVLVRVSGTGALAPDLVLAVATVVASWVFVQVVFTVHDAHVYSGDGTAGGGLDFNGDAAPDFSDFLYFTITVGATSQTSDTDVTSKRMRRVVTAQGAYAFLFNTSILALAVNMAAGLAQH